MTVQGYFLTSTESGHCPWQPCGLAIVEFGLALMIHEFFYLFPESCCLSHPSESWECSSFIWLFQKQFQAGFAIKLATCCSLSLRFFTLALVAQIVSSQCLMPFSWNWISVYLCYLSLKYLYISATYMQPRKLSKDNVLKEEKAVSATANTTKQVLNSCVTCHCNLNVSGMWPSLLMVVTVELRVSLLDCTRGRVITLH